MVNIIGIFAIVLVYYCEINAELDNLQYRKTPTADVRRILPSRKKFAGKESGGIKLRWINAEPRTKFTTGFREDIKDSHREYVLINGEARYNDLEHRVVMKRRFKRNYKDEENKRIDEHDNERKKRKKKKKHHHHSRRKMNKNHNSTRNKKTKRYKNDTKRNDMEEKYNEDHSGRKLQNNNNSTRNKKAKRYNDKDRNRHKDIKLKKEKKHSGKGNRDKNHSKYSEHLKDMSMSYEREKDHINKKKKGKDKSKDKQREKNMDRNKLSTRGGSMRTSIMGMLNLTNKNDHKQNKKQKLSKNKDKRREKSQDRNRHATIEGPLRISEMGMMSPANKKYHKHTRKKERNKSKDTGNAALVGKPLEWKSIKEPKLQSEEVQTSTTTPKPQSEEVQKSTTTLKPQSEEVQTSTTTPRPPPESVQKQKVVKLIKRERSNLRTQEKKRVTRMIPFSLKKQEDEEKQSVRQNQKEIESPGSPPSNLSPYAITAQMELIMKEFPNVNATVTKVGRTVEYNDLILVKITEKKRDLTYFRAKESKYVDDVLEKKIIFIVHGLTVMGLKDMTSLVKSSELKLLLSYYFKYIDKFDFFLMPLANPDGYSASLSPVRTIWNKNVSPQSVCPGVFVDRNFDVAWNHTKEISSCSQTYPGARPFSEEESKVVRDVFHHFSHKILAYIHVHAGTFDDKVFKGDAILYPRGYTEMQSDDDKYIDIKGEVDEAMKNASFRVMSATVDTLSNWYGVVSGTSVDYAATVFGIPYALEFVMQIYDSESLNNNALTEIWSRLIDATFNKMWKSLEGVSDARRFG